MLASYSSSRFRCCVTSYESRNGQSYPGAGLKCNQAPHYHVLGIWWLVSDPGQGMEITAAKSVSVVPFMSPLPNRRVTTFKTTVVHPYALIQYPRFTAAQKKFGKLKK
jgi:hypothetical protein